MSLDPAPPQDADARLDAIDRVHDDAPQAAADALRALDLSALSAGRLRLAAFLLNHVLGEKLGAWTESLARLGQLAARADAPPVVLRQLAVAAQLGGDRAAAPSATLRYAQAAGAPVAQAAVLVDLAAGEFAAALPERAASLARAAAAACAWPPGPLDEAAAATFNNATSGLYYATRGAPPGPELAQALRAGADAAQLFWRRAGGWMQHERAAYLVAKVALHTGATAAAIAAAEHGLGIVDAHPVAPTGPDAAPAPDPVERAFLLQVLAAGVERAGDRPRAAALRAEVGALAAGFDEDLRRLLADDAAELARPAPLRLAFIGGGNMAAALLGGLQRAGALAGAHVVEVDAARRAWLESSFGASTAAAPDAALAACDLIVLAVKPQQMREVCGALRAHVGAVPLLSIAAGTRATDIARWAGTDRVIRAMPNTPALIGAGISGAAALPAVDASGRALADRVLACVGKVRWFDDESVLDPVTAVSGSGPAYVFLFIEALERAARGLGFADDAARELALETFRGAALLAAQSPDPVAVLRERVTSRGGTTAAALSAMQAAGVPEAIAAGVRAADARAKQLGDELGRDPAA